MDRWMICGPTRSLSRSMRLLDAARSDLLLKLEGGDRGRYEVCIHDLKAGADTVRWCNECSSPHMLRRCLADDFCTLTGNSHEEKEWGSVDYALELKKVACARVS